MTAIAEAAERFLSHSRIAVTGVSRNPAGHGSNSVFQRLGERGYDAVPINPNADEIGGVTAYPDLKSVPGVVEAVVIGTAPDRALATVKEAVELGIGEVWMHRAFDDGSVDDEAVAYGREHGVTVIDGGCPLMFGPTADGFHKLFMCPFLKMSGKVPREV
ncbi:CoA-binding protein [uncultured Demequina sp.]|uniref:CoA-binding protein n=1 Tax=uncultured Demequina sp. TaxID=693499 RepID=UPI0025E08928|nr:CoA-binding protein [uncultured Demequina sp.]